MSRVWTAPTTRPAIVDRKPPSGPTYASLPDVLDWLRPDYGGNTVIGLLITDRATGTTYRVDAESPYAGGFDPNGTSGTYTLTAVPTSTQVNALLAPINTNIASNINRITTLESTQAAGVQGYDTLANLNADLSKPNGFMAKVTNDNVTVANNGEYRKSGAAGTGSWIASSTGRVTLVENRTTALEQGAGIIAPTMASTAPLATLVGQTDASSVAGQSGYRGYRTPVGTRTGVRRIIVPINFTAAPTLLTLKLYSGGVTGTLVATLNPTIMPTTVGSVGRVTFDSSAVLGSFDYAEVLSDALMQQQATVGTPYTQTGTQIATGGSYAVPGWYGSLTKSWYMEFYTLNDTDPVLTLMPKLKAAYRLDLALELAAALRADGYQAVTTKRDYAYTSTYATVADVDSVVGLNNSGAGVSYYGGGSQIGTPQNFNFLELSIAFDRPTDGAVKQGRFLVYDTSTAGTLLADVTQPIAPPTGARAKERVKLPIYLPSIIANAAANQIYVVAIFDGGVALQVTPTVLTNTVVSRIVVGGTLAAPTYGLSGSLATSFTLSVRVGTYDATKLRASSQPSFADSLRDDPVLILPPIVYGVSETEMCIYFSNIVRSPLPWHVYTYDVTTAGGVGVQWEDGFRWTPGTGVTGDFAFTLDIYLGDVLLNTVSCTLRVSPKYGPAQTRKLLQIGDSLTEQGYWLAELMRLSGLDTQFHLTLAGTRTTGVGAGQTVPVTTLPDSGGTERVVRHEGVSGKSVSYHYSDPLSNFTFNGTDPNGTVFSFAQYLAANPSVTLASGDWVTISLGTNDIFSMTRDEQSGTNVKTRMNTYFAQLEAMITSIQAAVSGIRVGICTIIPPASSQDGFAIAGNGTGMTRNRHKRSVTMWNERVISQFGGRTGSNVYVVPVGHAIDTVNGVGTVSQPASGRITRTVVRQNNGLHFIPIPAATATTQPGEGVWQMSDASWAFFKAVG